MHEAHGADLPARSSFFDQHFVRAVPYADARPAYPPTPVVPAATKASSDEITGAEPAPDLDFDQRMEVTETGGCPNTVSCIDEATVDSTERGTADDEDAASPDIDPVGASPQDGQPEMDTNKKEGPHEALAESVVPASEGDDSETTKDSGQDITNDVGPAKDLSQDTEEPVARPEDGERKPLRELYPVIVDPRVKAVSEGIIFGLRWLPEVADNYDGLQGACYEVLKSADLRRSDLLATDIGKIVVAGFAARAYYAGREGSNERDTELVFAREYLQGMQRVTGTETQWTKWHNVDLVEQRARQAREARYEHRVDESLSAAMNEVMHGDHPAMVRARDVMVVGSGARWPEKDFEVVVRKPKEGEGGGNASGGIIMVTPKVARIFLDGKNRPAITMRMDDGEEVVMMYSTARYRRQPIHEWFHEQITGLTYPFMTFTGLLSTLFEAVADRVATKVIPHYPDDVGYPNEKKILDQLHEFRSAEDTGASIRDRLEWHIAVRRDMPAAVSELVGEIGLVSTLAVVGRVPDNYALAPTAPIEKEIGNLRFGTIPEITRGMREFRRRAQL